MKETLQELWGSKRFFLSAVATAAALAADHYGLIKTEDALSVMKVFWGASVFTYGLETAAAKMPPSQKG